MMSNKEFLSVDDLSKMMGVSRGFLAELRKTNEGPPYFKVGNRFRYPVCGFDAWVQRPLALPKKSFGK